MGLLKKNDFMCVNLECGKPLSNYEVGRQNISRKYRFCVSCRNKNRELTWRCKSCGCIMTSTVHVSGKYYCKAHCKATQIRDSIAHAI